MADRKSTYEIIFGAENKTGGVLKRVSADFASLKKEAIETSKSMSGLADNIGEVAGKASIIGGALVAAFGVAGVAALKFNDDVNFAVGKTVAALGLLPEEADRFEKIIKEVYGTALPETLEESADLITKVFQKFGDVGDEELKKISEGALVVRKIFDADLNESVNSASALMKNFGLSSDEAFDFIAGGFQKGLNSSGDFLDTIQEYSTQFKDGGATASEFFSVLQTGLAEGVLGTDKAADAFKEFRLRVLDDTKATREALDALGIDADKNFAELSNGTKTVSQSFQEVITAVGKISDPVKRQTALVGLLGTQFEDLGAEAFTAIDTTKTNIEDLKGATDRAREGALSLTDEFTKLFRQVVSSVTDLDFLDTLSDKIGAGLELITNNFAKAFKNINFAELEKQVFAFIEAIANDIRNIFGDVDLTSAKGLQSVLQQITDSVASILAGSVKVADTLVPAFKTFGDIMRGVREETSGVSDVFKIIGGITDALVGAVSAAGAVFLSFASTAVSAFLSIVEAVSFLPGKVFPQVEEFRKKLSGIQDGLKGFRDELSDDIGKGFKKAIAGAGDAVDAFSGKVGDAGKEIENLPDKAEVKIDVEKTELETVKKTIDELTLEEQSIKLALGAAPGDPGLNKRLADVQQQIAEITEKKPIGLTTDQAAKELNKLKTDKDQIQKDPIRIDADTADAKKKLDDLDIKKLDLEVKLEITKAEEETKRVVKRIEEQSKIISEALKFEFELDMKKAELVFQTFDTAVKESTKLAIEATKANTDLFGSFSKDNLDFEALYLWRQQVRQNLSVQERQAAIQEKILEQTLEEIKLRNQLKRDLITGEKAALRITIDDRLGPMLTAAVKEAIPYLQLWGETEDAAEFLIEAAG